MLIRVHAKPDRLLAVKVVWETAPGLSNYLALVIQCGPDGMLIHANSVRLYAVKN